MTAPCWPNKEMAAFTSCIHLLGFSYSGNLATLLGEISWENQCTHIHNKARKNGTIAKDSPKCSQYLVCEILFLSFFSELEKDIFIPKSSVSVLVDHSYVEFELILANKQQ